MALPHEFQHFAQQLRNEAGILVIADNRDVRAAIHDPHLPGVLQVLPQFTVLAKKLDGFFLIL